MKDWCSLISIICEKYDKSFSFIIIIYYLGSLIKLDEFKWDDHFIQEIILQGIPTLLDRYFFLQYRIRKKLRWFHFNTFVKAVNVFVNLKPVYFRENNNNNPDPLKNISLPPAPVPPPKIDRRLKPFNRPGSGDSATLPAGEIYSYSFR